MAKRGLEHVCISNNHMYMYMCIVVYRVAAFRGGIKASGVLLNKVSRRSGGRLVVAMCGVGGGIDDAGYQYDSGDEGGHVASSLMLATTSITFSTCVCLLSQNSLGRASISIGGFNNYQYYLGGSML